MAAPDSSLRWTSKSVRRLASELQALGHTVSYRLVANLLRDAGYCLQANRKTREGTRHPDRDAQFAYLNAPVHRLQQQHRPTIPVDMKKTDLGKVIPSDVYDLARNEGWVSVASPKDSGSDRDAPARSTRHDASLMSWRSNGRNTRQIA